MDRINELLARLGELSADELAELTTLITAEADTLAEADVTAEVVAALSALGDATEAARAEQTRRDEEAAALTAQREEALARLRPAAEPEDDAAAEDLDPAAEQAAEVVAEAEAITEAAPAPVAVAASSAPARQAPTVIRRPSLGRASARTTQPAPRDDSPSRGTVRMTALTGQPLDRDGVTRRFAEDLSRSVAANSTARGPLPETFTTTVTAHVDFPADRYLTGDSVSDSDRVDAVVAAATTPDALVAAGGLCAPIVNLYDVNVIGTADRPVRDSFPSFGAERGGVSLRGPVIPSDMAGAIGTWTLQNDIDASTVGGADPTKSYASAICQGFTDYYVAAVTEIVEYNNVTTRFDPEMARAVEEATAIAFAKKAENTLLTQLNTFLTPVTTPKVLGAIADILASFDRTLAWWKTRRRLSDGQRFHAWGPRWVRDMMRADLVRSLWAKGVNTAEAYALADSTIDGFFAARGVNVTWHLDGRATAQTAGSGIPAIAAQDYASAALTAAAAVPEFPDTVEWQITLEGDVLYLDGGEINLGTVRDSTLNSTNKFRTFREEFFGLAFRGADGLQLVQTLDPTGIYAGWIDTTATSD